MPRRTRLYNRRLKGLPKKAPRLLLAVLLAVVAGAQSAAQAPAQPGKLFLWEAVGEKGKAYLLGSIHLAREDLYPLDEVIESTFARSEALVVEVDLNQLNEGALQLRALGAGIYGDGRSLESELSSDALAKLQSFLEERGVPFGPFSIMKPWLAAMSVTAMETLRLGYKPEFGIDKHFLDQAERDGKPVSALETADFQIRLLSEFSEELQLLFLSETLDDIARIPDVVDELVTAWKRGDAKTIENVLLEAAGDARLKPLYDKLFYRRNVDMASKIADLLDSGGSWFVVVGAGHLVGDEGIIRLLSDRQFEIKQVSASGAASSLPKRVEALGAPYQAEERTLFSSEGLNSIPARE